jgi:hypothetical protein
VELESIAGGEMGWGERIVRMGGVRPRTLFQSSPCVGCWPIVVDYQMVFNVV